jgi:hypothetical protein
MKIYRVTYVETSFYGDEEQDAKYISGSADRVHAFFLTYVRTCPYLKGVPVPDLAPGVDQTWSWEGRTFTYANDTVEGKGFYIRIDECHVEALE